MTIRDDLLKECAKAIDFSIDVSIAIWCERGIFPFAT
jgi:hypothetical protein